MNKISIVPFRGKTEPVIQSNYMELELTDKLLKYKGDYVFLNKWRDEELGLDRERECRVIERSTIKKEFINGIDSCTILHELNIEDEISCIFIAYNGGSLRLMFKERKDLDKVYDQLEEYLNK